MLDQQSMAATRTLLNSFFLLNEKPAGVELSDGQLDIIASILYRIKPRVACLAPTGYGKSEAVAMGVILRTILFNEPFIVQFIPRPVLRGALLKSSSPEYRARNSLSRPQTPSWASRFRMPMYSRICASCLEQMSKKLPMR